MALAYHIEQPRKSYLTARVSQVEFSALRSAAITALRVAGALLAMAAVTTLALAIRFWPYVPHSWH